MDFYPVWASSFSDYMREGWGVMVCPRIDAIHIVRDGRGIFCYRYSRRSYLRLRKLLGLPVFTRVMLNWQGEKVGQTYKQFLLEGLKRETSEMILLVEMGLLPSAFAKLVLTKIKSSATR
jgi:hypothetical protein